MQHNKRWVKGREHKWNTDSIQSVQGDGSHCFLHGNFLETQRPLSPPQAEPRVVAQFALKGLPESFLPQKQPTMAGFLSSLMGADFTFTSIMHECQWMQWINAKQNNKSCIPWVLPALSNAGERIECHSVLGKTSFYGGKAGPMVYMEEVLMFSFQMLCMNINGNVQLHVVC